METILRRAGYPVRVLAFDSLFLKIPWPGVLQHLKRIVGGPRLNTIIRPVISLKTDLGRQVSGCLEGSKGSGAGGAQATSGTMNF